jgi:lipopolysaccharide heptosyltransferase II
MDTRTRSAAVTGNFGLGGRLLVRGVNWLGDAVMTTPALLRLRERFPDAHIALLTPAKLAELWGGHPAIDEIITFAPGEGVFSIGKRLRAEKFDRALVLPNSPRSALEVYLGGVPERLGYARPWRSLFLTQAVPPRAGAMRMHKRSLADVRALTRDSARRTPPAYPPAAHQMHEYLHLAEIWGASPEPLATRLYVRDEEVAAVRNKFGLANDSRAIFGLNAGAEYGPAKRWPAGRFIAAARQVMAQKNCRWLVFGGPNDGPLAAEIAAGIGGSAAVDLAGRTSLRELMALLKLCRVLLTNDTGPMHVAAALGTPVVTPFGSTSPELTGPGLPGDGRNRLLKSEAACSPCFLRECPIDFRCMNGIGIDRVAMAVLEAARQDA